MLRGKTLGRGERRRSGTLLSLWWLLLLPLLLPPRWLGVARRWVYVDCHSLTAACGRSALMNDVRYRFHHVDLR